MATSDRDPNKNVNGVVFNRGVPSFPTPVISDQIVQELVSTETGTYTPLDYGTQWDDVHHGPFQPKRPGFQLVFQAPADPNGWSVRSLWVNDRLDQELYNYSITYSEGDTAYPSITRVYVLPREGYTPLAPLTPDPDYPTALLTEEQMINEVQPQELFSKYVKVARVYETLPGPTVTTQDFDDSLNILVYTDRQVVLSSTTYNIAADTLLLAMNESPRTKYTKLRIRSYLQALPATYTNYATGQYQWPNLVFGITATVTSLTSDPDRSEVRVSWDKRDAPTVPALLRVSTSFATTLGSAATLYVLPVRTLLYQGISFQVSYQNALNDSITVSASFTADAKYGDLSESHNFAATSPTASSYQSSVIGTYQIIGYQDTRWRGQIRVIQQTEALMI